MYWLLALPALASDPPAPAAVGSPVGGLGGLASPEDAAAKRPVELAAGAFVGMHAPQDPGNRDTGPAAGARLRLRWSPGWAIEGTAEMHPEGPSGTFALARFLGNPSADLVGVLSAGLGLQADARTFVGLGGGLEVRLAPWVDLRAEMRVEVETAGGAALLFGVGPTVHAPRRYDADGDGVPDRSDACPRATEDRDGWADVDGCPDPDNDNDRVPDLSDGCPNAPEDPDGHQDTDGCPDLDDDADGVFDALDACPRVAEDADGWDDDDGCPDYDNDQDTVRDEDDLCPDVKEDPDAFEDDDGCPEPDNDGDGVADRWDDDPLEPEVYNGWMDGDGVPDVVPPVVRPLLGDQPVTFAGGMAIGEPLVRLGAVLASFPGARVVVIVSAPTGADARAAAVKQAVEAAGADPGQVEVRGVTGPDRVRVGLEEP